MTQRRNVVVFESDAFNCSEPRPYFINSNCFGDDVATWLSGELAARDIRVGEVGQEDFGWYFFATCEGAEHIIYVGFRPEYDEDPAVWIVVTERQGGGLLRFLFRKPLIVADCIVNAINGALRSAAHVRGVKWHLQTDFDAGREDVGTTEP